MITVKVGEFRNRLSAYLRKIRQGAEIVISDRETPIGRLVPYGRGSQDEKFEMIDPSEGYEGLGSVRAPKLGKKVHAVDELLRDRHKR